MPLKIVPFALKTSDALGNSPPSSSSAIGYYLGLFLGSLFYSIGYMSVLMPVLGCSDYSGLII